MKKIHPFVCALLTAVMLSIPWLVKETGLLLLFAFVPLLYAEQQIASVNKSFKIWVIGYLSFLCWNIFTTWWLYCVSEDMYTKLFATLLPIIANALLMSIPWILFHHTKKRFGNNIGYVSLVCYWLAFEYCHLNWDLSYPWLTLGNGFATSIHFIQWYEYTGSLGGSVWILIANIVLFQLCQAHFNNGEKKSKLKLLFASSFVVIFPIILSLIVFYTYHEKINPVNIVVVQPNIDPYNEKFDQRYCKQNLQKLLDLAASKTDSTTDYFVGPETALVAGMWENHIHQDASLKTIREFIKPYPKLKCVVGASTYRMYDKGKSHSATARKYGSKEDLWYDAYNTALELDHTDSIQIYHKSKLVPGSEKMPYPRALKFLEFLALDLGGIVGTLGVQDEPSVFYSDNDSMVIAPAICYESIYGEYVTEYIKKGAQLIFVITNDGWWDNTPGHLQHLSYSNLRAIETRRCVARSANTGVSCFINQKGEESQTTEWWVATAIQAKLNANKELTFYVKHGDYIGLLLSFCALLLLLGLLRSRF